MFGRIATISFMDEELSVDESIVEAYIKIYPNPTTGFIKIESPAPITVLVKDVTGKTVIQEMKSNEVDLSKLADGVYMICLYDDERRLIKQERISKIRRE